MAGFNQVQGMALQQTLSPQMQQSLHILQAPISELRQLVAEELAQNPFLEETTRENPTAEPSPDSPPDDQLDLPPPLTKGLFQWTSEDLERRQHFLDSQTQPPTLQSHLQNQLDLEGWSGQKLASAKIIIGSLDEDGYYRGQIEEAAYPVGLTVSEAEAILEELQDFDPPGVCARNLSECLLIQLRKKGRENSLPAQIVRHHLELLARKKYQTLARLLDCSPEAVAQAAEEIRQLNPRPGAAFSQTDNPVIAADVIIEKIDGEYSVRINDEEIPPLVISNTYKDLLATAGQPREVRDFLREKLRDSRFFLKCIEQRNLTLLAIANQIVERQRDFLEYGPSHLRPLTMSQVASALGIHETTVSRAVSGKYAATPQGLFELKYFFTSGYTTSSGEELSNESIRRAILEIIRSEDPSSPLSDQQIVETLQNRGIPIARRTVAKYREQLGILPSHLRKNLTAAG